MRTGKRATDDPIPVYYRLQNELRERIESGEWASDEAIPSTRELAQTTGLSMGTVQKAVNNLINEGFLYAIQGKGTFVAGTSIRQEYLRYVRLRGHFEEEDEAYRIHLLGIEIVPGFAPANDYLKLEADRLLYKVRRLFVADSGPILYAISYLPKGMFENLEAVAREHFDRKTLYQAIDEVYGLPTVSNKELIAVEPAGEEVASRLGVKVGSPLLAVEMLSFTYKDQPYEYRKGYFLTHGRKLFREMR